MRGVAHQELQHWQEAEHDHARSIALADPQSDHAQSICDPGICQFMLGRREMQAELARLPAPEYGAVRVDGPSAASTTADTPLAFPVDGAPPPDASFKPGLKPPYLAAQ